MCDDVVLYLHDPGPDLRALMLEVERRVPGCARPLLGGTVTSLRVALPSGGDAKIEVYDDERTAYVHPWTEEFALRGGVAFCAIILEGHGVPAAVSP